MLRFPLVALARAALVALAVACWGREARALDPAKSPSQYVMHQWRQSDEGLPQNYVPAMVQTRDGYLWLATQEGVVRFDGVRFVTYSTRDVPELGTDDVDALYETRDGALWIGTLSGGLVRYVGGKFTAFKHVDGLANDNVLTLHESRDGALWIGTRGGVSRLKDGRFTTFGAGEGLANDTVSAIAEQPDGTLWFGTGDGLSRLDAASAARGSGRLVTVKEGLSDPFVSALVADADGTMWVGSIGGLDRMKDGAIKSVRDGTGRVRGLLRDRQGSLWIGAQEGLWRLSPTASAGGVGTPYGFLTKLEGDGIEHVETHALLEDQEGNIWAGTEALGLLQFQDGKVTTYGSIFVWSTLLDPGGTIWLAGDPGLFSVQGDTLVPSPAVAGIEVRSFAANPAGGLWLGTADRGVIGYRDGKLVPVVADAPLPSGKMRAIYVDARGALWLGTSYGLLRVDGGKVKRFHPSDGVPDIEIRGFTESADGSLWISTAGGLLRMKDGAFSHLTVKDGLSSDALEGLYADGDDLWIGTYGGGLDLLRGGRIGRVLARNGLFNNVVYSIVDDQLGNLWMTCNRGIFHAAKSELAEVAMGQKDRLVSPSLGTSDGMKSSECNGGVPAGVRTRDGQLWFPTTAGVARVDPAHMPKNSVVPPVLIESVRVNRATVDLADRLDFPAGSRDFEIVYTALSFTAPERVRFKYRLEGFDKDWVDVGARRIAYYTNLAPGRYRFTVIAANDDGVWNDVGADVAFKLEPHFYQTLPFYLVCALGLIAIGIGSVLVRLLALRQTAAELEVKVEQRTLELGRASSKLEAAFRALAEKDQRLHADLLQAKAFQERILPRLPSGGNIRFRAVYRPADLVGGDVYDVHEIAPGHYRVFMADTTGHGVQASLRTMVLKTEYDRVKLAPEGPGRVLGDLNRKLATVYPDLAMRCSACCFDVIADDEGALLRYANAAHPPLLRVSDGDVDEIYSAGTFLGMVAEVTFPVADLRLGASDRLLAYTDGICEQEDDVGRAFGVERMEQILASGPLSAEEIVSKLDGALTEFAGERPLDDDVVLVCVECAGERRSLASLSSSSWAVR